MRERGEIKREVRERGGREREIEKVREDIEK